MLLLFQAGGERYALDTTDVVEIVPLVQVRPMPHTPPYVAGLLRYRGRIVPVVDLTCLLTGTASVPHLSTRIILVHCAADGEGNGRVLGLIGEKVVDTIDAPPEARVPSGVRVAAAPYLDKIALDDGAMVQILRPEAVLPAELKEMLFDEIERND